MLSIIFAGSWVFVCSMCHNWTATSIVSGLHLTAWQKSRYAHILPPWVVEFKNCGIGKWKKVFYPVMTYCYIDLKTSLQHLLLDPNFTSQCTHWKLLSSSGNELNDGCV